jgi:Bifunctional DNA primase/polymerase, N-terminal
MNTNRIRFGTHARILRANGWSSIIPVKPNKAPVILGWSVHGLTPPSDQLIEAWRTKFPECGIGYVADGNVVAFDADISIDRFRKIGFTIKDAERAARSLSADLKALAVRMLGPIDFVRVGLAP